MNKKTRPKIVCLGGGTGTYQVLLGLKKYPVDLTAVVCMSDSGGSSGKLREEMGILPPGDIRRALLALSDVHIKKNTLTKLFDFRFQNGQLAGHSLGNLLLAALVEITGRQDLAIAEASEILEVSGTVLPVTLDKTDLVARLKDGTIIRGETNIDIREIKPEIAIDEVYLSPIAQIMPKAKKAILEADLIVLGPGDLYTSIIPNLLVKGTSEAIVKSKGKLVYVCNLMTKHGETDNFKASDFANEICRYLGKGADKLKIMVVNDKIDLPYPVAQWYKKYHSEPVVWDKENLKGWEVISQNLAQKGKLIRHDSDKLAKILIKLI
jgi:uncharacterized cofD-like protein